MFSFYFFNTRCSIFYIISDKELICIFFKCMYFEKKKYENNNKYNGQCG